MTQEYRIARISKIVSDRNYVVTHCREVVGAITFSTCSNDNVWKEESAPAQGAQVVLSDIRLMDGGWRAFSARYLRPEDTLSSN